MKTKKLEISKKGEVLLGVLKGLADFTGWDVVYIRLAFIVLLAYTPVAWMWVVYLLVYYGLKHGGLEVSRQVKDDESTNEDGLKDATVQYDTES